MSVANGFKSLIGEDITSNLMTGEDVGDLSVTSAFFSTRNGLPCAEV